MSLRDGPSERDSRLRSFVVRGISITTFRIAGVVPGSDSFEYARGRGRGVGSRNLRGSASRPTRPPTGRAPSWTASGPVPVRPAGTRRRRARAAPPQRASTGPRGRRPPASPQPDRECRGIREYRQDATSAHCDLAPPPRRVRPSTCPRPAGPPWDGPGPGVDLGSLPRDAGPRGRGWRGRANARGAGGPRGRTHGIPRPSLELDPDRTHRGGGRGASAPGRGDRRGASATQERSAAPAGALRGRGARSRRSTAARGASDSRYAPVP